MSAVTSTGSTTGTKTGWSPFHPDYGLTDEYRLRALLYAERTDMRTAAAAYNVGLSSLYRWRDAYRQTPLPVTRDV